MIKETEIEKVITINPETEKMFVPKDLSYADTFRTITLMDEFIMTKLKEAETLSSDDINEKDLDKVAQAIIELISRGGDVR